MMLDNFTQDRHRPQQIYSAPPVLQCYKNININIYIRGNMATRMGELRQASGVP